MNDRISHATLNTLVALEHDPVVSILMPAHAVTAEADQDPIRLRNLLNAAEERLRAADYDIRTVRAVLEPGRALLGDQLYWRHQSQGLALYLTPDASYSFRVPLELEEAIVIGRRAQLKPILPLLSGDGRFYVLALSQNEVRLLEGTRDRVQEVALGDVPKSLAEALKYDEFESQLQYHTGTGRRTDRGLRGAYFHGHGVGTDDEKTSILRFFQQINDGMEEILDAEQTPLVLAGVDYLHGIYRQANHYGALVDEGVTGNPEQLSAAELHAKAWSVVAPIFQRQRQEAADRLHQHLATGAASQRVHEVVRAAHSGRIDTAFVATDRAVWGSFNPSSYTVTVEQTNDNGDSAGDAGRDPDTEDLLNLVALQTLAYGGTLYAVPRAEMPVDAATAAVFRYKHDES